MSYPAWETATAYTPGQYVTYGGLVRICQTGKAHTSGVFADDDAAGKWATAYESLTDREKSIVAQYDNTARQRYEIAMELHRKDMELAAIHSQYATLFLTKMYPSQDLDIPGGSSFMATAGNTNALNNARIEAEARIAANVTAKAIFRQMLGSDRCEELG